MPRLGIKMVDQEPRRGVAGQVAFMDATTTKDVMIELVQPSH